MGEKDRNRISGEDLGWLDLLLSGVMSVGFVCVGNFCTIREIGWWRTQNFCNRPKCGLKLLSKGNTLYSQYKLRSKKTVKCFYFVIQYSYYKLSIWKVEVKKLSKLMTKEFGSQRQFWCHWFRYIFKDTVCLSYCCRSEWSLCLMRYRLKRKLIKIPIKSLGRRCPCCRRKERTWSREKERCLPIISHGSKI